MNVTDSGPLGRPGWGILGVLLAGFFVLGAGWSLTTAPGGSPDEIQHSFRAWSVWSGQILLDPLPTGGSALEIGDSWPRIDAGVHCFVLKTAVAADCAPWPVGQGANSIQGNSAGRYNPVYYLLVGLPFQFAPPETALHLARLLSSLITAVLLTLAAGAVIVRGGSVMTRVGLVAGLTPMALFLGGTVNPSGMEIAGAVAGWTGLILLARHPTHRAVTYFAVVTAVGLSAMVVSRPASFIWLVVPFVVFLIAAGWRSLLILVRRRAVLFAAAVVAMVTAGCVIWNRLAGTSDVTTGVDINASLATALRETFRNADGWWVQQIGVLGWLDTAPPAAVHWGTVMIVAVVVLPALVGGRPSMRLAALAALVAAVVVPLLAQTVLYRQTGLVWQGRYTLPLSVGVVIVSGLALDETSAFEPRFASRLLTLSLWLWAGIGILMGFYNLQRYATGTGANAGYSILWSGTPWRAPISNAFALGVLAVGYLAVAVALRTIGRGTPTAAVGGEVGGEVGTATGGAARGAVGGADPAPAAAPVPISGQTSADTPGETTTETLGEQYLEPVGSSGAQAGRNTSGRTERLRPGGERRGQRILPRT